MQNKIDQGPTSANSSESGGIRNTDGPIAMFYYLRQFDWITIGVACAIVFIGLATLFSIAHGNSALLPQFIKQMVFAVFGIVLMILAGALDYRTLKQNSYLLLFFYILSVILLAGVLVFTPQIKGIHHWYVLGPVTLDPSELAKIAVLLLLAKYFSSRHSEMYQFSHVVRSGFYVAIPAVLAFLQPDFGFVIMLFGLWFLILLVAGIKRRHLLILLLLAVASVLILWNGWLQDYQRERVLNFLNPQRDPLGGGYASLQSKIAIGSGGLWGLGYLNGPQVQYGFLSEPHTDFIFAAFVHEWGLIGAAILLSLFGILLSRIIYTAIGAHNNFSRFFAAGTAFIFFLQILLNAGMNLGLLPVVGLPLPFMSYGGSNLIASFILLGFLQSIRLRTPKLEAGEFKKDE